MVMEGIVLYAQEGRFEVQSSAGQSRLFMLSHRAALEPQSLPALQRAQARVRVRYEEGERGMWAIAHEVSVEQPVPGQARAGA